MNFTLEGRILKYVNEDCILIKQKNGNWKDISICINKYGYKVINLNKKQFMLHRIIGYLFLGLEIYNLNLYIDHIDKNRCNNNLNNLRIVTHQENDFNRTAKGYSFCKQTNKWRASIKYGNIQKTIGRYNTPEEARQAYLDAKEIYHIILEK